ncbi:hypothetical protein TNCV_277871 [Trichonephila clavipes]|nr:hypothetical protein TNCV_277871 [Trichonephila clavipes]
MGRILEVFPGSDGLVRVVNVKTSTEAWRVVGRLEGGRTHAEVAQAIRVSQSVISRIWNHFWRLELQAEDQDKVIDGQQRPMKIVI